MLSLSGDPNNVNGNEMLNCNNNINNNSKNNILKTKKSKNFFCFSIIPVRYFQLFFTKK